MSRSVENSVGRMLIVSSTVCPAMMPADWKLSLVIILYDYLKLIMMHVFITIVLFVRKNAANERVHFLCFASLFNSDYFLLFPCCWSSIIVPYI